MNYVGIDISKYKHDCFIVNDLGEVLHEGFSFKNGNEGFAELLKNLSSFDKGSLRIGFEATGHYGINLKLFLEKNGYSFMELNALLVSKYVKSQTLRKTKTDKLDAKILAHYMIGIDYKPYPKSFYHLYSLKSLVRLRDVLVRQRSNYLIRLTNVLDCVFPEFKQFFNNKFSVTALYILNNYGSPENIANMNSYSFDIIRRKSYGNFTMNKFVKLKALAKDTVGQWNEFYKLELETLLDIHKQINDKVSKLEDEITKIITDMNPPTLSIKGIGALSAAVIISEFGDINRFSSPDKMLSFAGLEPGYFQSGTSEYKGRMVKRGSSFLRCAIVNCCNAVFMHNEVFANYYYKKRSEGKPHRVALTHVAKKLLRVIYTLETKKLFFDASKLR